jgi:hypothetical protein
MRSNIRPISLDSESDFSYDSHAGTSSESGSIASDAAPSASSGWCGVVVFGGRN